MSPKFNASSCLKRPSAYWLYHILISKPQYIPKDIPNDRLSKALYNLPILLHIRFWKRSGTKLTNCITTKLAQATCSKPPLAIILATAIRYGYIDVVQHILYEIGLSTNSIEYYTRSIMYKHAHSTKCLRMMLVYLRVKRDASIQKRWIRDWCKAMQGKTSIAPSTIRLLYNMNHHTKNNITTLVGSLILNKYNSDRYKKCLCRFLIHQPTNFESWDLIIFKYALLGNKPFCKWLFKKSNKYPNINFKPDTIRHIINISALDIVKCIPRPLTQKILDNSILAYMITLDIQDLNPKFIADQVNINTTLLSNLCQYILYTTSDNVYPSLPKIIWLLENFTIPKKDCVDLFSKIVCITHPLHPELLHIIELLQIHKNIPPNFYQIAELILKNEQI